MINLLTVTHKKKKISPNVHKGRWSEQEDQALTEAVRYFLTITKNSALPWNRIAENIPYRTGIQCQARWTEALDPAVRKGRWHPDEDKLLNLAIIKYGCCWIRVASMIPTRTQRQCRTRWNQIHSQQLKNASTKAANHRRSNVSPISTSLFNFDYGVSKELNDPFSSLQFNMDENQFINSLPVTSSSLSSIKKEYDPYTPYSALFSNPSDDQLLSSSSSVDDFLAQYSNPPSTTTSSSSSVSSHLPPKSLPERYLQNNSNNTDGNLLFATDFDFLL